MEKPICPVCNNAREIILIYKKIRNIGDLLKCRICGLCFIWPRPIFNKNGQVYTKEYYNAWSIKELGVERLAEMKKSTFDSILDVISKFKEKGTLLDVGCAFGYLLESAKKRGWDVYGIEVSEYACTEARKKFGDDNIIMGDFMNLSLPKDKFDVITMVDLVEHIYDIGNLLKRCRELLRNKGLLVIVTPCIDTLSHKFLRRYWPHFNEEHVAYFSKRAIKKILEMNDYKLLNILNFKKALNFYYIQGVVHAHCKALLVFLVEIVNIFIPSAFKKRNFFIPHGEILVIAEKK